jgi:hypothetical protein
MPNAGHQRHRGTRHRHRPHARRTDPAQQRGTRTTPIRHASRPAIKHDKPLRPQPFGPEPGARTHATLNRSDAHQLTDQTASHRCQPQPERWEAAPIWTGPHRRRFAQGGGVPALAGNLVCLTLPAGPRMARIPAADSHPDIDTSDQPLPRLATSRPRTDLAAASSHRGSQIRQRVILRWRGRALHLRRTRTGLWTDRPQWTAADLRFPSRAEDTSRELPER